MKYLMGAATAALVLGGASMAFAGSGNPASDSATASATVISPLTVTKLSDLQFGKIVEPASGSGTASVAATSGGALTMSGVTAPGGQTVTSAHFTVTGDSTTAWTAAVAAPATLTSGANSIPFAVSNSTLTGSPAEVYVGGQITVASTAVPATYTGTITVSAQYN